MFLLLFCFTVFYLPDSNSHCISVSPFPELFFAHVYMHMSEDWIWSCAFILYIYSRQYLHIIVAFQLIIFSSYNDSFSSFFLNIFFNVDPFKVFIEFVTILLLFYVLAFWPKGMWNLWSPTRDQTCTSCIGRWGLNHWTTRPFSSL